LDFRVFKKYKVKGVIQNRVLKVLVILRLNVLFKVLVLGLSESRFKGVIQVIRVFKKAKIEYAYQ